MLFFFDTFFPVNLFSSSEWGIPVSYTHLSEMLLKDGVEAAPWMVTPNLTEMESLFQTVYQREEQVIEDARKLIVRGISLVCVSMGALGALLIERGGVWKAGPIPNLQGKIAKGAGCAMTAGLCLAAEQELSLIHI